MYTYMWIHSTCAVESLVIRILFMRCLNYTYYPINPHLQTWWVRHTANPLTLNLCQKTHPDYLNKYGITSVSSCSTLPGAFCTNRSAVTLSKLPYLAQFHDHRPRGDVIQCHFSHVMTLFCKMTSIRSKETREAVHYTCLLSDSNNKLVCMCCRGPSQ